MKIGVVGAGYVGLTTGVGFAHLGHEVVLADIDKSKVSRINSGSSPIFEAGVNKMLPILVGEKLRATTDVGEVVRESEVIFLCVNTPCQDNGIIDLTTFKKAVLSIGTVLGGRKDYPVIAVKSTVTPGTTEESAVPLLEENSGLKVGKDFGVVVNPEFLSEGRALEDFLYPTRIVIGQIDQKGANILVDLYKAFQAPLLRVDAKTAEMIKLASNAALATKISFINEIADMCKRIGIDVYQVAKGVGLDPRISPHFLQAGVGFGGSCLPKDTKIFATWARGLGCQPALLESVLQVNEERPTKLVDLAEARLGQLKGKKVAILGLTFKPGTDDIREAPSLKVVSELLKRGISVIAYDPVAQNKVRTILGSTIEYAQTAEEAIKDAEVIFILTEWDEFRNPALYFGKRVFAGRRLFELDRLEGFDCEGLGW